MLRPIRDKLGKCYGHDRDILGSWYVNKSTLTICSFIHEMNTFLGAFGHEKSWWVWFNVILIYVLRGDYFHESNVFSCKLFDSHYLFISFYTFVFWTLIEWDESLHKYELYIWICSYQISTSIPEWIAYTHISTPV